MGADYQKWVRNASEMGAGYQKFIQIEMIQNQIVRNDNRMSGLVA